MSAYDELNVGGVVEFKANEEVGLNSFGRGNREGANGHWGCFELRLFLL